MTAPVTIVGGGPAGLACALALHKAGRKVRVLEAGAKAGGRARSRVVGDWLIEQGPAAILDNSEPTREIINHLDLTREVLRGAPAVKRRYLAFRGVLTAVPSAPPGIFSTPLLSARGKLRLLGDLLVRPRTRPDESLANFFRRHIGDEATDRLVEPMQSGIFAGDIEQLSAHACFPQLIEMEARYGSLVRGAIASRSGAARPTLMTVRGGLQRVVDAMAQKLGAVVETGHAVTRLPTTDGPVVLALPAMESAPLIAPLDAEAAALLQQTQMVPMAAVTFGYMREQVTHPLDGFGFLVPRREKLPGGAILGTIFMSSIFPDGGYAPAGHVLLRVLLGGAHSPEVTALDDTALVARARDAIERLAGASGEPRIVDVVRWPHGIDQYRVGHLDRLLRLEALTLPRNLHFIGSSFRGPGFNDALAQGWRLGTRLAQ